MKILFATLLNLLTITAAFAQGAAPTATQSGGGLGSFIPLILIMVIFYFLIIRPQSKKIKEHAKLISSLHRGDRIITAGGIEGLVTKVEEDGRIDVEISPGVVVKVIKATVTDVVSRGQAYEKSLKQQDNDNKKAA